MSNYTSEVSGTAKGGTDGQEVHKEAHSGGSRWHNTPKAGTVITDVVDAPAITRKR